MKTVYETNRLVLKILGPDAMRPVLDFQLRNRELFERYEPTRPDNFYTLAHQQAILKCEQKLALSLSTVRFYVFLKENPLTIIGTVCLRDIVRMPYFCCEIGYKFDHAYHHMGYAREAVDAAVTIAFRDLMLHRVFARVIPDNLASVRLLSDLSFTEEGLERDCILIQGKWTDHLRFGRICPF